MFRYCPDSYFISQFKSIRSVKIVKVWNTCCHFLLKSRVNAVVQFKSSIMSRHSSIIRFKAKLASCWHPKRVRKKTKKCAQNKKREATVCRLFSCALNFYQTRDAFLSLTRPHTKALLPHLIVTNTNTNTETQTSVIDSTDWVLVIWGHHRWSHSVKICLVFVVSRVVIVIEINFMKNLIFEK